MIWIAPPSHQVKILPRTPNWRQEILLKYLAHWFDRRYERTKALDNLTRAINISEKLVHATSPKHSEAAHRFWFLGNVLRKRYDRTESLEDLDNAIKINDMALYATPEGCIPQALHACTHAKLLGIRYEKADIKDDLEFDIDYAIFHAELALQGSVQDDPSRPDYLRTLASLLQKRFNETASMEDINKAVNLLKEAISQLTEDLSTMADYYNTLGVCLARRQQQSGSAEDLNSAIDCCSIAVNFTTEDDPRLVMTVANLGNLYGTRFECTGSTDDLNNAINMFRKATKTPPRIDSNRAGYLMSLGHWLGLKSERSGLKADIDESIEVSQQAVDSTPPQDHFNRALHLHSLGRWLSNRYGRYGDEADISRAIEHSRKASKITPPDHPPRASYVFGLGNRLFTRYNRKRAIKGLSEAVDMEDLNEAVEIGERAIEAIEPEHGDRALFLTTVGSYFGRRYEETGSTDDLNRALVYYLEGATCETAPPIYRIDSARHAATILADQQDWQEADDILQGAVDLLHLLSPRLLNNNDKQHQLAHFSGLASLVATVTLEARNDELQALQSLESGRCLIAGSLLELRTNLSKLRQQHPTLATEFDNLRAQLDVRSDTGLLQNDETPLGHFRTNQRYEADDKLNNLIGQIRECSGFQRFLLPPTQEEFLGAAEQGPIVIINVTKYRCDAFVIEHHGIRVLHLPELKECKLREKIEERSIESESTLIWLWSVVAKPVLDALGYKSAPAAKNWPRIWWIPTGLLSHFPIHAAWSFNAETMESVLDTVISSYALSVRAVMHGRSLQLKELSGTGSEKALLVAMQQTPGQDPLYAALEETDVVARLCPSLKLTPIKAPGRRDEVLKHLQACTIFHFAGHGHSDIHDPARSRLLLEDHPLNVGELRDTNIHEHAPFLGFLSACSTSANKQDRLVDESIHLASALQLAGFRHVIGTLWKIYDRFCVDVARTVYETIREEGMTDLAVSRGLHKAVRRLRDEALESAGIRRNGDLVEEEDERRPLSTHWAPYIHFGV